MNNKEQLSEASEIIDVLEEVTEAAPVTEVTETELVAHPAREAVLAFGKNNFHTLVYSGIGLVAAILFMVLGFWRTLLILCLVGIGAAVGRYQDGSRFLHHLLMRLLRKAS